MMHKLQKHKLLLILSGLPFCSWVIIRTIFSLKNFYFHCHIVYSLYKINSLISQAYFLIPYLFQVFQGPDFSAPRFFRVRVQVLEVARKQRFHWRCSGVFMLTWTHSTPCASVSVTDFDFCWTNIKLERKIAVASFLARKILIVFVSF